MVRRGEILGLLSTPPPSTNTVAATGGRRADPCAPSVPAGMGSAVQLLPHPQFSSVCMTQAAPRSKGCKGDDEVAKRKGKGVRHTGKSGSQLPRKVREQTPWQLLYSNLCSGTAIPCRLAERHGGVTLMLLQLSLWIFTLLFYLAKSCTALQGLTSLLWLPQIQIPMPLKRRPRNDSGARDRSKEQQKNSEAEVWYPRTHRSMWISLQHERQHGCTAEAVLGPTHIQYTPGHLQRWCQISITGTVL